jgi:hypothetical protein
MWANRGTKRDKQSRSSLLGDGKGRTPALTQEFRQVRPLTHFATHTQRESYTLIHTYMQTDRKKERKT